MGYFTNVWDLFLLKDETYRKIGNSKHALTQFIVGYLLSMYLSFSFFGLLMIFYVKIIGQTEPKVQEIPFTILLIVLIIGILLLPLVCLTFTLLSLWIRHLIGLAFGGKPRNFLDFAKVSGYTIPLAIPFLMLVGKVLGPIYDIWFMCMLYKTYRNIHKLDSREAGWAIFINVLLYIAILGFMVIIILFVITHNPTLAEKYLNNV